MNFIEALISGLAIFIGTFGATIFVAHYVYTPLKRDGEFSSDSEEEKEPIFEDTGKEEVKTLKQRELKEEDLEHISKQTFTQETKQGDVIMQYDHKTDMFFYYANFNVLYKTLDAVARQFVLKYDCKAIYHPIDFDYISDISEEETTISDDSGEAVSLSEIDEIDEEEEKVEEVEEEEEEVEKSSTTVFARFKNYRLKNATNSNNDLNVDEKRINKFLYKGKADDYNRILKAWETKQKSEKISYQDFKKSKNA